MYRVDLMTMVLVSIVMLVVLFAVLYAILRTTTSWPSYKALAVGQAIAAVPTALVCWYLYDVIFAIGFLGVQVVVIAFRQYALSHDWT